jgi:hypothetical protein
MGALTGIAPLVLLQLLLCGKFLCQKVGCFALCFKQLDILLHALFLVKKIA